MKKTGRSSNRLLFTYVAKEYLVNFVVAFLFFFFIFFVNQILLLVQEVAIQSVSVSMILELVVLSIPEFLIYTFPFSSLTAASMVIGDLSSKNEILAMRASGISIKKVFIPIIVCSLLITGATYMSSDRLTPWAAEQYKTFYSRIIQGMPSMELDPYSVREIGSRTITNGPVENGVVHDILLFDTTDSSQTKVVTAAEGSVNMLDANNFIYSMDLVEPTVLFTNPSDPTDYSFAKAETLAYTLDLSSEVPSMEEPTPSQMRNSDLVRTIEEHESDEADYRTYVENEKRTILEDRSLAMRELRYGASDRAETSIFERVFNANSRAAERDNVRFVNFYYQYYVSEFHKKLALSAACFFLVFIAFPISFFRVKHGRLIGFGLSIGVAVAYWFMLFFAQLSILDISFSPAFIIWGPNILIFVIALILIRRLNRL